jgi:hypothetical protein
MFTEFRVRQGGRKILEAARNEALLKFHENQGGLGCRLNPREFAPPPLGLAKFNIDGGPHEFFICGVCFW